MRLYQLRNLGSIIALRFSPSFLGKGLGLCLTALLIGHSSPTLALGGDDTKFTLNALPSFETVPADKKAIYQTAQAQGYCSDVLEIEQEGLVQSRPEFNNRFSVGTVRNKAEQTALEIYALGYRRCQALKHLSRVLAIPKLKAGIAPYAPKKPSLSSKIKNKDMDMYQVMGNNTEEIATESPDYSEDDILLVMQQAQVSKEQAIEALTDCNGDLAQAILKLTT